MNRIKRLIFGPTTAIVNARMAGERVVCEIVLLRRLTGRPYYRCEVDYPNLAAYERAREWGELHGWEVPARLAAASSGR